MFKGASVATVGVLGLLMTALPAVATSPRVVPQAESVAANTTAKKSKPKTYRATGAISGARVRLVDRVKQNRDVVRASGSVAKAGRPKQLRRLVRRGAVVTVSTRSEGTKAKPRGFTPLMAISFGRGDCERKRRVVWCNDRGAVLRAKASKRGRLHFAARIAGQQLRQTVPTKVPLSVRLSTTGGIWQAAPSKCRAVKATLKCHGRTAASARRSAPVRGPVPLKWVRRAFTTAPSTTGASLAADDDCGSVVGVASTGALVAVGFISFIPVVGDALVPIVAGAATVGILLSTDDGASCIEAEFEMINQQLADQESQIANLQASMELQENQFYQGELSNSVAVTEVAAKDYSEALEALSPTVAGGPGLFGQFMEQTDLWTLGMQPVAGASVEGAATTPSTFQAAMSMASDASSFTQNLNDMSGSQVPVTKCPDGGCANVVQSSPSSALLQMWDSKAQTLLKAWQAAQDAGGSAGSNVVGLYDEYNNSIIADYAQSLSTLQQSFQMEYMVNQMNLYHAQQACQGSTTDCQQIDSFGMVPGTSYSFNTLGSAVSENSQIKAYNKAQKQLAATYASRLNTLYVNTLNYMASDVPVAPQAYPTSPASYPVGGKIVTSPNPIDYSTQVGASLPSVAYGPARTPMLQLPDVIATADWTSQGVLYQFQGLRDVNKCVKSVAEYNYGPTAGQGNPFTNASCPPIFSLSNGKALNQGYYDGDRIQPYTSWTVPPLQIWFTVTLSTGEVCTVQAELTCSFTGQPLGPAPTATVTASNGAVPTDVQVQTYQTSQSKQLVSVTWQPGPEPAAAMRLAGNMQVNLRLCDATDPDLTWFQPGPNNAGNAAGLVEGRTYLSCGNWGEIATGECFPGAHCPLGWSQLAPAPNSYVTSQYYQTANSYPNTTSGFDPVLLYSNNQISYNGSNWMAAVQFMGTPGQAFQGSGVSFDAGSGTWYFDEVSDDSSTWKYAVSGLPTGNAANKPGGRFNVPVQVAYWDESKSNSYASFIPRQDAQMDVDGFECTGNSCTVADGSTYSFSLTSDSGRDAAGWASLSVD